MYTRTYLRTLLKTATQLIENAHYDPITRLQIRIFSAISFGHSNSGILWCKARGRMLRSQTALVQFLLMIMTYDPFVVSMHYSDVMMSTMASQITIVSSVCSTVCSDADQRKYQSSTSLALCEGNSPVTGDSPHKGLVTRRMFPFDDVIMDIPMYSDKRSVWHLPRS